MLKKGDRVRFLNTTGGGIVCEILGKDLVKVTDEDGFDIPVLARECVLIENVNEENNLIIKTPEKNSQPQNIPTATPQKAIAEKEDEDIFDEIPDGDTLNVSMAFVPENVKKLQETTFDWYLVNDCNYHLYYTISAQSDEGKYLLLENGLLHRNTTFLLRTLDCGQLSEIEHLKIQVIAFKDDKSYEIQLPVSRTLHIKPVSFVKLHSFTENDYFDEQAMVLSLTQSSEEEYDLSSVDFSKIAVRKEAKEVQKASQPQRKNETIEVDLHINQLMDNTNGLSATDMLNYQLKVFEETMQANLKNKGRKIVFIHGKGNGTLRNELLKLLKTKFKNCPYQDASFREYGFGATMITIR